MLRTTTILAALAVTASAATAQDKPSIAFVVNAASDFWKLAEAGVNWVTVGLPTSSRSAYLNALDHFAATFLPREGR